MAYRQNRLVAFCVFWIVTVLFFLTQNIEVYGKGISNKGDTLEYNIIVNLGEQVLDWVTWEEEQYVFTIYPSLSASARNGFVCGLAPTIKWNSFRPGKSNTLTVNIETSTKGVWQFQLEHEWFFHPQWMTSGEVFFIDRTDQYWFEDENMESFYFEREEFRLKWDLLNNIFSKVWVGAEWLFSYNVFSDEAEGQFLLNGTEGATGGWLIGIGPKFEFDSRSRTIAPQKGTWIQFSPSFVGPWGWANYRYFRTTLDVRHYHKLKKDKSTLAFQTILDFAGSKAPFYERPQIGGKERLRGIAHPLWKTGNAMWMLRGEWRQHIWWRIGGVFFTEFGEVGENFKDPFNNIIKSIGGGLRFRMLPHDPLNVRFDIGVSSKGTAGFYVSLKEAF
ncbi:BamA/TamA family outer membrane protein [Thermophagus xiamenensis]|uniref:Surface antigen n=1 Tax=Thermophagus xiamenensis TaxID=385682 RepID=A0A1I1VFL5_9BACT|nr:BamA/TamA family outer membrane protein [Thermophagus xiamenensis]SFD79230.1 Surface antigen [Thermophagus xiamenensis]